MGPFPQRPSKPYRRWEHYRKLSAVALRADWADYPGGRVIYDTLAERFRIYAYLCIISNPMIAGVKAALNLPSDTEANSDDRNRCQACLSGPLTGRLLD